MQMRGLFALFAACSITAAASPAQAQERLTVAAQRVASNGPLFFAAARNYFRDEGLDIELKFFPAAQQGANAVVTGQADLAAVELTAPVLNFAGRGAIKAIAGQSREKRDFEGNSLVASNGAVAGGFKNIADLAGRSLAIPQLGSVYHYQAGMLASTKGFDIKSVTLKPLQTMDAITAALVSGQADAAILPPDAARSLSAVNDGKGISWISDVGEPQLGALFAAPSAIATKRDAVQKFVRAYQRGANDYAATLLRRNRYNKRLIDERAHEAALAMAPLIYPSDPPQDAAALIEAAAPYADPQARIDVADFLAQFAWFKAQGLLDASAESGKALDLSFIPSHLNAAR